MYYAKHDYDSAIADYEAALRIDPDNTSAKTGLADVQNAKKEALASDEEDDELMRDMLQMWLEMIGIDTEGLSVDEMFDILGRIGG